MQDDLPPWSSAVTGYALSCTPALEEIRQAAVKHHAAFTRNIEDEFLAKAGTAIRIPPISSNALSTQLKSLLIMVPSCVIQLLTSEKPRDEVISNTLFMFHPLFTRPLDNITVTFMDTPGSRSLRHERECDVTFNKSYGRWTREELSAAIDYSLIYSPYDDLAIQGSSLPLRSLHASLNGVLGHVFAPLEVIQYSGPYSRQYLDNVGIARVQTKRIAIACDFRESEVQDSKIPLQGVRFGPESSRWTETLVEPGRSLTTEFYAINSNDGLVGECGLIGNDSWGRLELGELRVLQHRIQDWALGARSLGPYALCFSRGLGLLLVAKEHSNVSNCVE
ncbi:hypothetical protein BDV96DRAFT_598073 [Lophiotrema nucula]|uniref:Uncharacterized protein n=1 Tax=Lophiotrema nucula TaxID=690887 RepID=A0A6A5ZFD3_9PLEO|nr:hypothetical protein BDV96DRAFT_598073 [Lophiotrema nucula]